MVNIEEIQKYCWHDFDHNQYGLTENDVEKLTTTIVNLTGTLAFINNHFHQCSQ